MASRSARERREGGVQHARARVSSEGGQIRQGEDVGQRELHPLKVASLFELLGLRQALLGPVQSFAQDLMLQGAASRREFSVVAPVFLTGDGQEGAQSPSGSGSGVGCVGGLGRQLHGVQECLSAAVHLAIGFGLGR